MANSLSASFPTFWSKTIQTEHAKIDVYRALASFSEQKTLKKGDTVERPYTSRVYANDVGTGGSYARQDITDTSDQLTVDQEKEATIYIKDADEIQSNYREGAVYAKKTAIALHNQIDGQFFGEYDQANSSVDDGDIGGTDGNGVTLSVSNVAKMFTIAGRKMSGRNVSRQNRWAAISPEFYEKLVEYVGGKESVFGDSTSKNGHIGRFMGFNLYESNNLSWSGRLAMATNPTDGDTITINGVTLTFKDTLGSTAGNIHICSTAAKTLDNLEDALEAPDTSIDEATDTGYVAVSSTKDSDGVSDQDRLRNIEVTDGGTYLDIVIKGCIGAGVGGYVAVSETLTDTTDTWTAAKQIQHNLFGQGKPIDLVIQKYPNLAIKDRSGYIGKDFVTWTLFAVHTFHEMMDQLVDVQIRADAF